MQVKDHQLLMSRARTLRHQATDAELALWRQLRARRLGGFKFRRQQVVAPYIVDFVCLEARLIVEADGGQHADDQDYDERRTEKLEQLGYRVMRFWNNEILGELPAVLELILVALQESTGRPGTPSTKKPPPRSKGCTFVPSPFGRGLG